MTTCTDGEFNNDSNNNNNNNNNNIIIIIIIVMIIMINILQKTKGQAERTTLRFLELYTGQCKM